MSSRSPNALEWDGLVWRTLTDLITRRGGASSSRSSSVALESPPPLTRDPRRAFSQYALITHGGEAVRVPRTAVAWTMHKLVIIELHCARAGVDVDSKGREMRHMWYWANDMHHCRDHTLVLTKLSNAALEMGWSESRTRALEAAFPRDGDEDGFHERACVAFAKYYHLVRCRQHQQRQSQKSQRQPRVSRKYPAANADVADPDADRAHEHAYDMDEDKSGTEERGPTCVVCLCADPSAHPRCRRGTCRVSTCATCWRDSRGLCSLCDRSSINASYQCSACGKARCLTRYGYQCISCTEASLCDTCHVRFGMCTECEVNMQL